MSVNSSNEDHGYPLEGSEPLRTTSSVPVASRASQVYPYSRRYSEYIFLKQLAKQIDYLTMFEDRSLGHLPLVKRHSNNVTADLLVAVYLKEGLRYELMAYPI